VAKKAEIPDQSDVLAVEEWGDQFVFRPVGKVFVGILLGTPITPNQITFARMGIAIFAMVLLAIDTPMHPPAS
jgi:hypothetical protein